MCARLNQQISVKLSCHVVSFISVDVSFWMYVLGWWMHKTRSSYRHNVPGQSK